MKAPRPKISLGHTIYMLLSMARRDGAISILNHPNFGWSLTPYEIFQGAGGPQQRFDLLEITSGHPEVHEDGLEDGKKKALSHEELWDVLLTHGLRVWGVGSDDSHHYKEFGKDRANPGRAWVEVSAPEFTKASLCDSIRAGRFYVSRGPKIQWWNVTDNAFELVVQDWRADGKVEFIGKEGRVLKTTSEMPAVYSIHGDEGYVRARVTQNGERAWTQPHFLR